MKKNYFLLISLMLLFVCGRSYAQMQGINASSERSVHNFQVTGDVLYILPVWENSDYSAEILLPSVCDFGEDVLNSITKYSDIYYVIGGRLQQTDELYWFDRKINIPTSQCYKNYETKVYFDMPYPTQPIPYTHFQRPCLIIPNSFLSTTAQYNQICLD